MQNHQSALILAISLVISLPTYAETNDCTVISSLPAVITAPGVYCLKSDLMTGISSGNAITINSNFVTLDLNGWRLGGGAGGTATQAVGIYAVDRRGLAIKNGSIRGFQYAIFLDAVVGANGTTNVVEGIRADGNTAYGIYVGTHDSVIRNNQVTNTGGSTLGSTDDATAIKSTGSANRILDNDVSGVATTKSASPANGIVAYGNNTVVSGNRISDIKSALQIANGILATSSQVVADNQIVGGTAKMATGIFSGGDCVIRNNLISGYATGIDAMHPTTIYSGNVVVGATIAYFGGTLHGTTNAP